jgi:hypothetical protein
MLLKFCRLIGLHYSNISLIQNSEAIGAAFQRACDSLLQQDGFSPHRETRYWRCCLVRLALH